MARAPGPAGAGSPVTAPSRRRGARSPAARNGPWGQARQVVLRPPPGHEVGDDPGGAERHGPPHVAVAGVEDEVPVAAGAEDGWAVGSHRPEARAVLPPVVVGGVREDVACEAEDVVEVAGGPAPVVARELGGRGEPEAGAQPRPPAPPRPAD